MMRTIALVFGAAMDDTSQAAPQIDELLAPAAADRHAVQLSSSRTASARVMVFAASFAHSIRASSARTRSLTD